MKVSALSLFKVYTDEIDFCTRGSVQLPNSLFYYNQQGEIVEIVMTLGGRRHVLVYGYKKFDLQCEADALELLFHVGRRHTKKVDLAVHKLCFKWKNRQLFVNPDGWYVRPLINGLATLVVARDKDVVCY